MHFICSICSFGIHQLFFCTQDIVLLHINLNILILMKVLCDLKHG